MGKDRCLKCLRGAMTVHIGVHGLCNECETERAWKNGKRVSTQQRYAEMRHKLFMKKTKEYQKRIAETQGR